MLESSIENNEWNVETDAAMKTELLLVCFDAVGDVVCLSVCFSPQFIIQCHCLDYITLVLVYDKPKWIFQCQYKDKCVAHPRNMWGAQPKYPYTLPHLKYLSGKVLMVFIKLYKSYTVYAADPCVLMCHHFTVKPTILFSIKDAREKHYFFLQTVTVPRLL